MNKEIKEKWIEALRSGRYNKIKGALKKDDGFCAVGVLCDTINPNEWYRVFDRFYYQSNFYCLPDDIQKR